MKFNATAWIERNYKLVAAVCVICATAGCCIWFFTSNKSSDAAFFAPIIYALVLYLIGVFTDKMSSNISASLPQKAEKYRNLKRVEELLSATNKNDEGLRYIKSNMLWTKSFTGRTGDDRIDEKPYIKENGLHFENYYLKIEQRYIDLFEEIRVCIDKSIREYVNKNKLSSKTPYFCVDERAVFEPEEWCKANFEECNGILDSVYFAFGEKTKNLKN